MKTTLHHYYFDTDNQAEHKEYEKLKKQLEVSHKFFNVLADPRVSRDRQNKTETVELDPSFLFNNQWNEAGEKGRRLFDWYEAVYPDKKIKEGHWLEITPEMIAIREHTLKCGYCGKMVKDDKPHKWYCEKCLGNEYLKEKDLGLLRLNPVATEWDQRSFDMTDAERDEILPRYKRGQASKNRQKVAALIPNAEQKAKKLIEHARIETEALTWLLDHGVNIIDNVIYYDHTGRFCFGWRTPLTADEKSKLLDIISEFPFDYDLK